MSEQRKPAFICVDEVVEFDWDDAAKALDEQFEKTRELPDRCTTVSTSPNELPSPASYLYGYDVLDEDDIHTETMPPTLLAAQHRYVSVEEDTPTLPTGCNAHGGNC